jgi:replicative DNA helicase
VTTFSRRTLHRRAQRQLPRAEQVRAVLETLTAHGWIRVTATGDYEVHPYTTDYVNVHPVPETP